MASKTSICATCPHRRKRIPLNLFSKKTTWTPDLYEAKRKWDEEQRELALAEKDRFQSGDDFDSEPQYFDWCAKWTEDEGRQVLDPVTGEKSPIFVLCARANAQGDCKYHPDADPEQGKVIS